jgi:uncharacterized protein involved in exopolysaccharide biosynthesis
VLDVLREVRVRGHALWRRRWLALATAWALMLLGSTIVVLLPDQYESSARVYVDTDSLIGPLLKGIAVEDDPTQQLAIMQSTLLSRPNLTEVAKAVFPGVDANDFELEGKLDRLKSHTVVEVTGKKLFRIAYDETDARLAKDVVQSFLNIFVEGNLGQDRSDMENAQSFIAKQLAFYEQQLQETEKHIADFQAAHADVISSSSSGSFSQRLAQARAEVDQAGAELAQAKERQGDLPPPAESSTNEDQMEDPTLVKLAELQAELSKKRAIYSDQHPDVIALEQQLKALQAQNAQAAIALATRRLASAKDNLQRLQGMASSAANVETELADLNRDYTVMKQKYEELRVRAESARISHEARTDTASLRFRIIDPPEVPISPSGPKRTLLLMAVLCASIGGGLALAFLLSELDDSFSTPQRLMAAFNLPLLGSVCLIPSKADAHQRYADAITVSIGAGSMVVLCVLLIALTSDAFRSVIDLTPLRHLTTSVLGAGA